MLKNEPQINLPSHPFWKYSLGVYKESGVKDACLSLQDRRALNVNVLLFSCWLASTGRGRLEKRDFQRIFFVIDRWHEGITESLRNIRNRLTGFGNPDWSHEVRKLVLEDELASEQVEQLLLADTIDRAAIEGRSVLQKATDAVTSLHVYAKAKKLIFDMKDYAAIHQLLSAVFPTISHKDIEMLCRPLVPTLHKRITS